jgi:predicted trehalose synthase
MTLSSIWAHLGTVLMATLATLSNLGYIHPGSSVAIALDAVAGLLVALHVVSVKALDAWVSKLEHDVITQKAAIKAGANATAAAQAAGDAITQLHSALTSTPPQG